MADDSDEEYQQKKLIDNQPYDETLEVPDAEEVASIYTPTPRHPKRNPNNLQASQQFRSTPPPTSSSQSSGSQIIGAGEAAKKSLAPRNINNSSGISNNRLNQVKEEESQKHIAQRLRGNKMSDITQSDNTPKPKARTVINNSYDDDSDAAPQEEQYTRERSNANINRQLKAPNSTPSFIANRAGNDSKLNRKPITSGVYVADASDHDESEMKSRSMSMKRTGNDPQQDTGESESEANDSADESRDNFNEIQGGYDPAAYRDLPVSSEIKDIFKYIERYQPQNLQLDFKLKPFIPDYIPSIGDIDAFIKVPRPDGKPDNLGFTVVDEPSSNQSDPHVIDLYFRTLSKQTTEVKQPTTVKSVEGNQTKAIDSWIKNISALQKNKPVQTVNYQRAMPSIDSLMMEWPPEFEELLKEVSLPSSELNIDLNSYIDIICAMLDIPVYKSRIQSLHVLFTLYSEFKNSEHFKGPATLNTLASQTLKSTASRVDENEKQRSSRGKKSDKLVIE